LVIKLMQRWRRRGAVAPERYGGWKRSPLEAHAEWVRALLGAEPDLTIEELRSRLTASGIQTSRSAWAFPVRPRGSKKKTQHAPPSRNGRTSPRRAPPGGSGKPR
jgi:transposase